MLEAASIIGVSFNVDLLAAVMDRPPLECLDLLAEAQRAGQVYSNGALDRYRFVDAATHEAVLQAIPVSRRVQLHADTAEAIGRLYADRLEAHVFELAGHWSAAALGGNREIAAEWVARAAEAAAENGDALGAAPLFRRAVELGGFNAERECELQLRLARASYRSSDVFAALAACEEAARLGTSLGRPDLRAEAALIVDPSIVPEVNLRLRALCAEAVALLSENDTALRLRLLARVADISHYLGDVAASRAACDELARLAPECTDGPAVAAALHAQQLNHSGPDGLAAREELAERLAELGDPAETAWSLLWRVDAALEHGDISRARRELDAAHRLGAGGGDVIQAWQVLRAEATVAQAQARYDDAVNLADDAMNLLAATGNPLGRLIWMGQQTVIRYHSGMPEGFASVLGLDEPGPPAPLRGPIQVLSDVSVLLALGRRQQAAALYRSLGPAVSWQFPAHSALFTWAFAIVCAIELGERDDLALARERLLPFRDHHVVAGAGCVGYFGPVELWLGVAAAHLGDPDSAVADLERALLLTTANGAVGFHAQAQIELAAVLTRQGGAEQMRRSRSLATEALDRATLVRAAALEDRARSLLGGGEQSGRLTAREQQVAALVAEALSNRDIGRRLYLSERTVANHVQHIFDKLGLSNRGQLIAWVREHGLSSD